MSEGEAVVEGRVDVGGDAAFATLAAAGAAGSLTVRAVRATDADDPTGLVVTGDAYPDGDGENTFVVLGAGLPLGSTIIEVRVVEAEDVAGAQVELDVDLPEGVLALDVEEEDAAAPLDGWEVDLGPGRTTLGVDLEHATGPSRAVLVVRVLVEG